MKISEIIARTLQIQKASVVNCVPGFGGTQVFNAWSALHGNSVQFSFHEEVAFGMCQGAAIAGTRAAMLTKTHGLAKAANAVIDGLYIGANAGLILMVFDDKKGQHSDNIFDATALLKGLRIPYQEAGSENIQQIIAESFNQSENLKMPVAILLDADMVEENYDFQPAESDFQRMPFERDLLQNLVVPVFAEYQHKVVQAKFAGKKTDAIPKPSIPGLPGDLPPDYAEFVKPYIPVFEVFKKIRGEIVFGDTGVSTLFAFPPYDCVDACSYMGGSVPLAMGAIQAGYHNAWAVTGDFSFIAAGHLGIYEAASKNIPVKVLIFKNDMARTTGGQNIHPDMLEKILAGFGKFVKMIDNPRNENKICHLLKSASETKEMQIVVVDYSK